METDVYSHSALQKARKIKLHFAETETSNSDSKKLITRTIRKMARPNLTEPCSLCVLHDRRDFSPYEINSLAGGQRHRKGLLIEYESDKSLNKGLTSLLNNRRLRIIESEAEILPAALTKIKRKALVVSIHLSSLPQNRKPHILLHQLSRINLSDH